MEQEVLRTVLLNQGTSVELSDEGYEENHPSSVIFLIDSNLERHIVDV